MANKCNNKINPDMLAFGANGLTKREYFIAMAMQGVLANSAYEGMSYGEITKTAITTADTVINEINNV